MIPKASFDPSRIVNLYFRVARNGSQVIVFKKSDGTPYEINAINFKFFIKQTPQAANSVMVLEEGTGLAIVDDSTLVISVNEDDTNLRAKAYYYELLNETEGKTWLSGKAFFHEGEFDDKEEDDVQVTVKTQGTPITLIIQSGTSGGSSGPAFMFWNFSTSPGNAFPTDKTKIYIADDDTVYPKDTYFVWHPTQNVWRTK